MSKSERDSNRSSITTLNSMFGDPEPPGEESSIDLTKDIVVMETSEIAVAEDKIPKAVAPIARSKSAPAELGWRGAWNMSVGRFLPNLKPSPKETLYREAVSTVQSATWERPMNVVVANVKGGSGKTLATVMLSEVLALLRGGQVAAWEACEVRGTLADRVSGSAANSGIPEFLEAADTIASLHDASQYLSVQASHAHALASPLPRAELRGSDVATMRRVLDTYFALTITDTGNNPLHAAWTAAITTADVLVIPCMTSADSVKGALDTLAALELFDDPAISDPQTGLRSRVIVAATSPVKTSRESRILAPIRKAGVRSVQVVPFDRTLAQGTAVSVEGLDTNTQRAWTLISAEVVSALTEVSQIPGSA